MWFKTCGYFSGENYPGEKSCGLKKQQMMGLLLTSGRNRVDCFFQYFFGRLTTEIDFVYSVLNTPTCKSRQIRQVVHFWDLLRLATDFL